MLKIEQQKAIEILKALIYQDLIDEDNKESRGEKINPSTPRSKDRGLLRIDTESGAIFPRPKGWGLSAAECINYEKLLIKGFTKFCGLSDDELDDLHEEVNNSIDEFENNTFWDSFAEKIAIVKREEEAEKEGIKFSQQEAFIKLCGYMDEVNDRLSRLSDTELIALWKYIAQYFK